jgi:hypothetical protein
MKRKDKTVNKTMQQSIFEAVGRSRTAHHLAWLATKLAGAGLAIGVAALVVGILALVGCGGACVTLETRCDADRVQICNAAEEWETVAHCAEFQAGLTCVELDTGEAECVEGVDSDTL